jgi:hypothetical protein
MPGAAQSDELAEYWQDQVNSRRTTGRSQASYCEAHDLSYHRFTYWRRKFAERHSESGGFALVKYRSEGTSNLSVALPNGLVVQGIASDNLELARQLLASLA